MFQKMKKKVPKYRHKVQGLSGDCLLPNLGLGEYDRELIVNKVRKL